MDSSAVANISLHKAGAAFFISDNLQNASSIIIYLISNVIIYTCIIFCQYVRSEILNIMVSKNANWWLFKYYFQQGNLICVVLLFSVPTMFSQPFKYYCSEGFLLCFQSIIQGIV